MYIVLAGRGPVRQPELPGMLSQVEQRTQLMGLKLLMLRGDPKVEGSNPSGPAMYTEQVPLVFHRLFS